MSDFHNLVEREIPRLRRYARALTRSGDRADDLVQEVLIRAIAKAHLWQTDDIRAWLFTIMHNQYVNMVRRAMREEASIHIEQMSSSLVATTDPTASCQMRELDRALTCLPDEQRGVIPLVGLEGLSYQGAAQVRASRSAPCARACRAAARRYDVRRICRKGRSKRGPARAYGSCSRTPGDPGFEIRLSPVAS